MADIVIIKDRKGIKIGQIQLNLSETTVGLLKKEIRKIKNIAPIRQWLTIGDEPEKTVLDDNKRILATYPNLKNGTEVTLKDIGIQLSWTAVFYAEYLGPIIIYGASYLAGTRNQTMSLNQKIGLALGVAHYAKRLYETHFVHIFSHDSMPLSSCWKNFFHYWVLFGASVGIEFFNFYKDPGHSSFATALWVTLWGFSQFMNFMCHKHLASLRKPEDAGTLVDGSSANKQRQIPRGWGFDQVSCANYLWETLAWVSFSGLSRCYSAYFFTAVSFYQMFVWALGKQRRYKKEFGKEFPKGRKAIIPFII